MIGTIRYFSVNSFLDCRRKQFKSFFLKQGSIQIVFALWKIGASLFWAFGSSDIKRSQQQSKKICFKIFAINGPYPVYLYKYINQQRMARKMENQFSQEYGQKCGSKGQKRAGKCYFRWTQEENKAYAEALIQFQNQLKTQYHRRSNRTFYQIAQFVRTRSSEQCRTHHQKMLIKYETVENIIKIFSKIKQEEQSEPQTQSKSIDKQTDLNILIKQEEIDSFVSVRFDYGVMLQDMSLLQQQQVKVSEDWLDCFNF